MATSSAPIVYAELAPHTLHLAVLSGNKVTELRAFALDAKTEITAFVAEQKLAGAVRASFVGKRNFVHLSAEAESGSVRQPSALQNHLAALPHGFPSAPAAVVCDAGNGGALDATRVAPWLLAAVEKSALDTARDTLGALGLTPADITVATPLYLGAIAGSLASGEVALVLVPGEEEGTLVWVSADGVQAVATTPVGYVQIFEAVQKGLGLKFRAAAGKLFYNTNYDFSDTAPAITNALAELLRPSLEGSSASILHVASLTPSQAWLGNGLAAALGLAVRAPEGTAMAARFGLTIGCGGMDAGAVGLLALAGAGTSDAPWVQPTLDVLVSRPPVRAKTAAPFARVNSAPSVVAVTKAKAPEAKPREAAPTLVASVQTSVPTQVQDPVQSARAVAGVTVTSRVAVPPARRGNKGPIMIGGAVALVASVVGLAMHFRSPRDRGAEQAPAAQTAPAAPVVAAPASTPAPAPKPVPAPAVPVPAPAPVVAAPVVASPLDTFASDVRRFGNERYRLEVTDKGFIRALATAREEVLVESAAGITLQGSYVGTDGRRKWFNVGGIDDAGYAASVKKSVVEGTTVFDVKVTHPRFELVQSFTCLESSVKVKATFTPINLRDPRGVIAAVHSVRLSPMALKSDMRMRPSSDAFVYTTKAGAFGVAFDSSVWGRDGAEGRQTIIAGENGVAFHFTETTDAARRVLNYELALP